MKMQDKKLKQFKVYKIIALVLFILTVVVGTIVLLGSLALEGTLAARGIDIAEVIQDKLGEYFPMGLVLPPGIIPHSFVFTLIANAAVGLSLTAYLLFSASRLFGNIYNTKTPFSALNIRLLRSMGIAFFVYTGLTLVLSSIAGGIMTATLAGDIGAFVGQNFNIRVDLAPVFYGLLLMALAQIFDYGASLQNDSESIV